VRQANRALGEHARTTSGAARRNFWWKLSNPDDQHDVILYGGNEPVAHDA
jgi:hypothetical protein